MRDDRHADPLLGSLKKSAAGGSGHGPLYDQGVLSVVEQVEHTGGYEPSRLLPLIRLADPKVGQATVTAAEFAEMARLLAGRGWTVQQGAEYARGVAAAQAALAQYRRTERWG